MNNSTIKAIMTGPKIYEVVTCETLCKVNVIVISADNTITGRRFIKTSNKTNDNNNVYEKQGSQARRRRGMDCYPRLEGCRPVGSGDGLERRRREGISPEPRLPSM